MATATGLRAKQGAKRAARSEPVTLMARAGYAARGVLWAIVGLLALQVARGEHDTSPGKEGAFELVARQPLGKAALAALAVGLAAYGMWRLVQAVANPGNDGEALGTAKRVSRAARGVFYLAVSYTAAQFVLGSKTSGTTRQEADVTARALELPMGRWLVAAVGLGFIVFGLWNGWRAATGQWRDDLETRDMGPAEHRWAARTAAVGLATRMVLFGLMGVFLVRAGLQHDPDETKGVDDALRELAAHAWGTWLLVMVATGLLAYGVFLVIEARYQRVND